VRISSVPIVCAAGCNSIARPVFGISEIIAIAEILTPFMGHPSNAWEPARPRDAPRQRS